MTGNKANQRITLLLSNTNWIQGKRKWLAVVHAALILTSLLKNEFEFSIIDAAGADLDEQECQRRLAEIDPRIILVSGGAVEYHQEYSRALSVAKTACPGAITVFGGVFPTTMPREAMQDSNVDYVFMGHAEDRLPAFLRLLLADDIEGVRQTDGIALRDANGEVRVNPVKTYIGDVKSLTQPDYSMVDIGPYLIREQKEYQFNSDKPSVNIISSYGCPYNCLFCATRTISGRKVAYRQAGDVLKEIDFLAQERSVKEVLFVDDHLLGRRDRIEAILKGLIERDYDLEWKASTVSVWRLDDELLLLMKKSGCAQITISVESGSPRVLKEVIRKPVQLDRIAPIVKRCRELDISLGANFVIGLPGETWEDIRKTVEFAEGCDFDVAHFHIATPLPETDLYKVCVEKDYLPADFSFFDPDFFGFGKGFITTEEFTPLELEVIRAFEWDRINFKTPEKMARVAKLYKISPELLEEHRRQTRRKLGIHY